MKKRIVFGVLVASLMSAMVSGCGKEKMEEVDLTNAFLVEFAPLMEENGQKAVFTDNTYERLIYQKNDVIYVNGESFTLQQSGGKWVARGTASAMTNATHDTLLGNDFSCLYVQSPAVYDGWYSSGSYSVIFTSEPQPSGSLSYMESGMVLAGRTSDSLVTMYPSFCVIRFISSEVGLSSVSFGFDDGMVVNSADINPQRGNTPYLSNIVSNFKAPRQTVFLGHTYLSGSLLKASSGGLRTGNTDGSWHVIVPLPAEEVTTNIYARIVTDMIGQVATSKTPSPVTLKRGYVYEFEFL